MKENQITASMAKDIAFKLGAVLNDEEAEIFADGYNAALLKVNKNASTELPNYANLSTSSQAAPDDSVLLPCPFCGSPAEHYPDGDMEGYIIMCGNKNGDCNLQAFGFTTPEEAEKAWNTRAALLQGGQPVSNHDELPYAQVKAVADLFALCWQSGEVVTYTPDPEKATIWLNNYSGTCVQEYVKLERLQEALAGNSPVIPDGWISCSERMPEEGQECLVQTSSGWRYVSFYDAHSRLFCNSPKGGIEYILVTHWMPLPAAPEPEQS
ncbi:DUF551 domain-containing protein [Salmonella enterica subsp. enterica serovar Abony]|nr:DUF551 domain-containing protein [Salmonella enterica subsp. enterica serovar Abony]